MAASSSSSSQPEAPPQEQGDDENNDDENNNNNNNNGYHEPIWLRGIRDDTGVLEAAIDSGRIVDNAEINVTDSFFDPQDNDSAAAHVFFMRVCSLPGLKSLRLLPDNHNAIYQFPIHLLTTIVQLTTQSLELLSVSALDLVGTPAEFAHFYQALRTQARRLKLVRLIRCCLPDTVVTVPTTDDGNDDDASTQQQQQQPLEELIETLSHVSTVREIELSATEENALGTLYADSLVRLVSIPTLQRLRLENFDFSEHTMVPLLRFWSQRNCTLQGACLASCRLSPPGLEALGQMLGQNQSLEDFSIDLIYPKEEVYEEECFVRIAQQLAQNSSLRELRLTGGGSNATTATATSGWPRFRTNTNNTLARPQQAFLDMLQHPNTSLERLSLFDNHHHRTTTNNNKNWQSEIDFYLALNRMGRKHIVKENGTKEDWLGVIVNAQWDLNCLFYFLLSKPDLLVVGDGG